jgi:superfamily I DNA/RNA helicase
LSIQIKSRRLRRLGPKTRGNSGSSAPHKPGTGKTTNLTRQIQRAVDRFGADSVLVTSFSRAAAAELAGRDLPISPDRVGTLHSHCWHALGGPEIAEANVEEWNRDNPSLPITPAKKRGRLDGEEGAGDDSETGKRGDELLQQLNRYRGLMLPHEVWNESLISFERLWTEYKRENGLFDFTDLIEGCLHEIALAPKNPSVIFADEAQDLNRMQLSLVRKWGERANYFIVAGDDDQTIYSFTGATPDAFLDPDIPDSHKIILKQSYRVPRVVHGFAESLIHQVARRQEKEYLPRPEDGAVDRFSRDGYLRTEYAILQTAADHIEQGRTVMFLASCTYMLRSLIAVLRKHGVPFHNPYRRSNGFWNPLRLGKRTSSAGRILSLLVAHPGFGDGYRPWTNGDVALWAEVLQSKGVLQHGTKAKLKTVEMEKPATLERLDEIFEPAALESLMAAWEGSCCDLLGWWQERLVPEVRQRVQFPALVAAKRGPQALEQTPQVIVGTIHSVKGGQADVVYLFPDLSQAGDAQYRRDGPPRDSVIRQFYVGVTRAREKLYICGRESSTAISI